MRRSRSIIWLIAALPCALMAAPAAAQEPAGGDYAVQYFLTEVSTPGAITSRG